MASVSDRVRNPKSLKPAVVSLALAIDHIVYQVEPVAPGEFGTKAFRLAKKGADGAVYDVIRTHAGLVECDCPSYEATHRGTISACKHGRALVQLGLLDAPAYVAAPVAPCCPADEPVPCGSCADHAPAPVVAAAAESDPAPDAEEIDIAEVLREIEGDPAPPAPADPEDFAIPAEVEATHWAWQVTGRLRRVAEDFQVRFAEQLLEDPDTIPGRMIRPLGPTLEELSAKLAEGRPVQAAPRPVRPALLPDGRYTLAELADAQGAFYAGWANAVGDLFAKHMRELASSIRATDSDSVAKFEGRIAALEGTYRDRIASGAFDSGYEAAVRDGAILCG